MFCLCHKCYTGIIGTDTNVTNEYEQKDMVIHEQSKNDSNIKYSTFDIDDCEQVIDKDTNKPSEKTKEVINMVKCKRKKPVKEKWITKLDINKVVISFSIRRKKIIKGHITESSSN